MDCDVCHEAAFVNVEAVRYSEKDEGYLKPTAFCFEAEFCPKCGRRLDSRFPMKVGGTDE